MNAIFNSFFDSILISDEEKTSNASVSKTISSGLINKRNIIFIDTRVPDYKNLLANIQPDTEVVILDTAKDGIAQITESLLGKQYDSLHIVSHGSAGSLQLGSNSLNSGNLSQYQNQLQQWKTALTEEADILLYGCDVAAGETGVGFVQQLSQLTGADVAASNDLTGNAALGGDWDLEVKTGSIESNLAFTASIQESFASVLNTPAPGDVIINEFSQGLNGKEWVEILVVKDNLNLQGARLVDGNLSLDLTLSGSGFASLKAGTLVVIYNGNDIDSKITPDLNYDPVSGDYILQIASNNNTGQYALTPTNAGTGWNTIGSFTNADNTDIPRLLNSVNNGGQELHKFARTTTPGSGQFSQYIGNSSAGATSSSAWSPNVTSPNATPGTPNPGDNTDWINTLRGLIQVPIVNTPQVKINNPSPVASGLFGLSLASNGSEILIGSPGTTDATVNSEKYKGSAYLFNTSGSLQKTFSNPSTQTTTQGSNERFGFAVAINTLAGTTYYTISAPYYDQPGWTQDVGRVYRYEKDFDFVQTLNNPTTNDDSEFGGAIAVLNDGTFVVGIPERDQSASIAGIPVTYPNAGQLRLFNSNGSSIRSIINPSSGATLLVEARFGTSLAAAGNSILTGAPGASVGIGRAFLINPSTGLSTRTFNNPNLSEYDFFGISVASNSSGSLALIGAPGEDIGAENAGVVYLFNAFTGSLIRTFTNPDVTNRGFGTSVAFIGDDIVIGSPSNFSIDGTTATTIPNSGAVYYYDWKAASSSYNLEKIFKNPGTGNDGFGSAITKIDDYRIAIAAPFYDNGANTDAGTAYIFKLSNATPTAANKALTIDEDSTYTFSASDFNFADVDGDTLQKIKITSLVSVGSLVLDNVAVNLNQEINTVDIIAGKLKFTPVANANGSNYVNFSFKVGDSEVFSSADSTMSVNVNAVNDAPTFSGGNQSIKMGSGQQTVIGWASFNPGAVNETGQTAQYTIESITNASIFLEQPTINADGNLIYKPLALLPGSGIRSATATIAAKVKDNGVIENNGIDTSEVKTFKITVTSGAINFVTTNPTNNSILVPTASADILMGTDQSDRIDGLAGDDTISGGLGNDQIIGGLGNDILYGDLGNLTAMPSYALANGITFNDIIQGNAGNDTIYGGWGNDTLYGNDGNDIIWGGDGDDVIWGVAGNDTFALDSTTTGKDTIQDFKVGEDKFGCSGGLGYSSLTFSQLGNDTLIKSGSLDLALVKNITKASLEQSTNFLAI